MRDVASQRGKKNNNRKNWVILQNIWMNDRIE